MNFWRLKLSHEHCSLYPCWNRQIKCRLSLFTNSTEVDISFIEFFCTELDISVVEFANYTQVEKNLKSTIPLSTSKMVCTVHARWEIMNWSRHSLYRLQKWLVRSMRSRKSWTKVGIPSADFSLAFRSMSISILKLATIEVSIWIADF